MEAIKENRIELDPSGLELFFLYIKIILLSVITLGIYSFWGRVEITKYILNHIRFMDERFDYHATGMERFLGFLKVIGVLILYLIALSGIYYGLMFTVNQVFAEAISGLINAAVIIVATPLVIVGSLRYRLSRTSYRSVRFRFTGKIAELMRVFYSGILMSIITLGIYGPWFMVKMSKFLWSRIQYGNASFEFDGKGFDIFKIHVAYIFGLIVWFFVYLFGIVGLVLVIGPEEMKKFNVETMSSVALFSFIALIGMLVFLLLLIQAWFQTALFRYRWNHIKFQGLSLKSDLSTFRMVGYFLISFPVIVLTLGIALPWVIIWQLKLLLESISLQGDVDFDAIRSEGQSSVTAFSDELSETGDFGDGFGAIF